MQQLLAKIWYDGLPGFRRKGLLIDFFVKVLLLILEFITEWLDNVFKLLSSRQCFLSTLVYTVSVYDNFGR